MKNPWNILNSTIVYDDPWLKLRLDSIEYTDTKKASSRAVVVKRPFVTVLAMTDARELVLVEQVRYATALPSLEVSMGYMEQDEDPQTAALRELKEETGYSASKIVLVSTHYPAPAFSTQLCYSYLATGLTAGTIHHEESEYLDIKHMPIKDVYDLIDQGKITDGPTIITLLRAKPYILEQEHA